MKVYFIIKYLNVYMKNNVYYKVFINRKRIFFKLKGFLEKGMWVF